MRVVHVISCLDPSHGGPTTALLGLASAQAHAGLAVEIIASFRAGEQLDHAKAITSSGVKLQLVGPTDGPLRRHPDLETVLAKALPGASVVHLHMLWEEIQYRAACLAHAAKVPFVIRPCGMLDDWCMAQSGLKKRAYLLWRGRALLERAALVQATSASEQQQMRRRFTHDRTDIVPNGISSPPETEPGAFRREHLGGFDGPLLLSLGRLDPIKNLGLVIDALAASGRGDTHYAIVGPSDAGHRAELERRATARKVRDRVHFVGPVYGPAKFAALRDADRLMLPSHHENFANVVLEALAVGTPVVVSDSVALGKVAVEIEGGACLPLDPASWSQAIAAVSRADQPAERRRLTEAVLERFDWRKVAERWVALYGKLRAPQ